MTGQCVLCPHLSGCVQGVLWVRVQAGSVPGRRACGLSCCWCCNIRLPAREITSKNESSLLGPSAGSQGDRGVSSRIGHQGASGAHWHGGIGDPKGRWVERGAQEPNRFYLIKRALLPSSFHTWRISARIMVPSISRWRRARHSPSCQLAARFTRRCRTFAPSGPRPPQVPKAMAVKPQPAP